MLQNFDNYNFFENHSKFFEISRNPAKMYHALLETFLSL